MVTRAWRFALLCSAVFAVAIATRFGWVHWSPFPSTLDGFYYSVYARDTVQTGFLPTTRFQVDESVFTTLLTVVSLTTGSDPLYIAQPMVAVTGGAACLIGVTLVVHLARHCGWQLRNIMRVCAVTGFGLALNGVYVRQSGATNQETLALVLLPLLALAVYRGLTVQTQRLRWLALAVLLYALFPLVHARSSLTAGLVLTAICCVYLDRIPPLRRSVGVLLLIGLSWAYLGGYHALTSQFGVSAPSVEVITAYPGLFLAWGIIAVVGALWLQHTTPRLQRVAVGLAVGVWIVLLGINVTQPVFPGTQTTPPTLLMLVAGLSVPLGFALVGLPYVIRSHRTGLVVVSLLIGPLAVVYFALTASLTSAYFLTALRSQTFVHLPVFIMAGLGVAWLFSSASGDPPARTVITRAVRSITADGRRRTQRRWLVGAVCLLIIVSVGTTLPLAFVHLDTGTAPSVTSSSQLAATEFTAHHTTGRWATDDPLGRVGNALYDANTSQTATSRWLRGGQPPACPTLAQLSWSTDGAHLFPNPAERLPGDQFNRWQTKQHVIYTNQGLNDVSLILSRGSQNASSC